MKIALPLCLLLACSAMSSEAALAAHRRRPNAAAAHSGPASDDAAKLPVAPVEPTGPPPSAADGKAGDAPPDTSITVNQGHHPLNAKEAAEKKLTTALGKLIPGQAKLRPPTHPFAAHVVPPRNATGALAAHPTPPAANRAAVVTAPAKPAAQPGAAAASALATPGPHDVSGTAAPASKSPAAIAGDHGAAVLKIVTANGASVNGTGVAKPAAATAAVGGPAKTVAAAAVGGASFRPKHP
jgi:hypothetical protein